MSEHTEAGVHGSEEELRERYRELLEELRTILPGVHVLLAFLLTVPFASRFTELDRTVSLGILVLWIAVPVARHRGGRTGPRPRR